MYSARQICTINCTAVVSASLFVREVTAVAPGSFVTQFARRDAVFLFLSLSPSLGCARVKTLQGRPVRMR